MIHIAVREDREVEGMKMKRRYIKKIPVEVAKMNVCVGEQTNILVIRRELPPYPIRQQTSNNSRTP